MRSVRPRPAPRPCVLEDGRQLRLKQTRVKKKEKRGRRIGNVNGIDRTITEVLFREEAWGAVEIRGQLMGGDSLAKGERREAGVLFSTNPPQIVHQLFIERFAAF